MHNALEELAVLNPTGVAGAKAAAVEAMPAIARMLNFILVIEVAFEGGHRAAAAEGKSEIKKLQRVQEQGMLDRCSAMAHAPNERSHT